MRTTILMVRDVDLVKQTFTCKFFLEGVFRRLFQLLAFCGRSHNARTSARLLCALHHRCLARAASWTDEAMLERDAAGALVIDEHTGKPKTRAIDKAASSQSGGRLVAKGDPAHYCFMPMLRFANRVDDGKWDADFFSLEAVEHTIPKRMKGNVVVKKAKKFPVCLVMWRVIGQGEFQCEFNLERFPFDEQTLVIKLLSGARLGASTKALCACGLRSHARPPAQTGTCATWGWCAT